MPTPSSPLAWKFSLRALLLGVTLVCLWLGWETSVVRERRRLREIATTEGVFRFVDADGSLPPPVVPGGPAPRSPRVSLVRRLLGDRPVQSVWYWAHSAEGSQAKLEDLRRAFPEASFSEYLPEPCHPGCFPAGTFVDTPRGRRPIESISAGEEVLIVREDGGVSTANVESVFVTQNDLQRVETSTDELLTTATQPLCLADGTTRQVGDLRPGDQLRRLLAGELQTAEVRHVSATGRRRQVFNLILGDSRHFVANGFVARSKPPSAARSGAK